MNTLLIFSLVIVAAMAAPEPWNLGGLRPWGYGRSDILAGASGYIATNNDYVSTSFMPATRTYGLGLGRSYDMMPYNLNYGYNHYNRYW